MELTNEEKKAKVRDFRPIDVFFEVLAQNPRVCQEMLRTLLEDESLEVLSVITQSDERNIYGRSVRLDALCILGDGSRVNVEVQRSDNDNHLKRARFNASSITVRDSSPGTSFDEVIELYIVYISEFDFLKGDKTIYHVDKLLRETGEVIDDGLHEIFVNTVIDDGTDIAELMACFMKKEVKSPKFPVLSAEVKKLKETEGGVRAVSAVMQKYEKIAVEEAMHKEHIDRIKKLLQIGCSKAFILELDYNEDEYTEAVEELHQ